MAQQYSHISLSERTLIFWWRKDKLSMREMARKLGRSHTTISREIKRNTYIVYPYYYPRGAEERYQYRLKRRAQRYRLKSPDIREHVINRLKAGWTPEIISGRLKTTMPENYICHEAIYQFIYKELPELYIYLPRSHKHRGIKKPYRKKVSRIKNRISITQRPQRANDRILFGHWESDSIVSGCRKLGINVLVERKSRLSHISLMIDKTAATNHQIISKRLAKYSRKMVRSITYDNGSENTLHEKTNAALATKSYFCAPYHSWEKGSVEQVNGLIRRYIPKGTDFNEVTPQFINKIEKFLNNRPRKCLNFQTPYEAFKKLSGALAH